MGDVVLEDTARKPDRMRTVAPLKR